MASLKMKTQPKKAILKMKFELMTFLAALMALLKKISRMKAVLLWKTTSLSKETQ